MVVKRGQEIPSNLRFLALKIVIKNLMREWFKYDWYYNFIFGSENRNIAPFQPVLLDIFLS